MQHRRSCRILLVISCSLRSCPSHCLSVVSACMRLVGSSAEKVTPFLTLLSNMSPVADGGVTPELMVAVGEQLFVAEELPEFCNKAAQFIMSKVRRHVRDNVVPITCWSATLLDIIIFMSS